MDAIDRFPRTAMEAIVWRVSRLGREPLLPSRSKGRWSDGTFDVLYTAKDRDGALAEIFALLSDQPVFPSKVAWSLHRLSIRVEYALVLPDQTTLIKLGVDAGRYKDRRYESTQEIAEAAFFLGFDALDVPSARWPCQNVVALTEHLAIDYGVLEATEHEAINWQAWRKAHRRK